MTGCNCVFRVRLPDKCYQCVQCGAIFHNDVAGCKKATAPTGWEHMDRDERALWAARVILKARL